VTHLPKVFDKEPGSGCHMHVSLWRDGKNITAHPSEPTLSAEAKYFVAGILKHLMGLVAITTPTTNSFRRLLPSHWAGVWTCWGHDNKEAPVRVPKSGCGGGPSNFEFKASDASANPFLAIGALIAAGVSGLKQRLEILKSVECDPAELTEAERKEKGIERLPTTLNEAIEYLNQDKLFVTAMGEKLFASFMAVRKAEASQFYGFPLEKEVAALLEKY